MIDTINFLKIISNETKSICWDLPTTQTATSEEGKYYVFDYNELKHIEKI